MLSLRRLPWRGVALACLTASLTLAGAACRDSDDARPSARDQKLAALPYLASTPVARADLGKRGVTIFDPERAAAGLNIYCSEKHSWFELRDMRGTARHRVELPGWCKLVKVHGAGFLVLHGTDAREEIESLSRVDWDGSIRWSNHGDFHHDFDVVGDEVYVLGTKTARLEHEGQSLGFVDNEIVTVDLATGKTLRQRSLRPALLPLVPDEALDRLAAKTRQGAPGMSADLFHVNTLEVLRGDSHIGEAGDILMAIRHLNLIGVLDPGAMKLTWQPTVDLELEGPHHPQLLDSGTILLFDNGRKRGWSRIVELDPRTGRIVWSYQDRDEPVFFSATRGSVQPLPSGNLLVAESDRGRWFELTRDKDIVWEYWTEDSRDEATGGQFMRDTTYRSERLFSDALPGPGYRKAWDAAMAADGGDAAPR